MTKLIPLTRGLFTLVDDDDYLVLRKHRWQTFQARKEAPCYAARRIRISNQRQKVIWMHRVILGDGSYEDSDHINGDPLDNRRQNLRQATHSQNGANQVRLRVDNTSGFRGVVWNKSESRWVAKIRINGRHQTTLGRFTDAITAARAYDKAAVDAFGEFARPNFPRPELLDAPRADGAEAVS